MAINRVAVIATCLIKLINTDLFISSCCPPWQEVTGGDKAISPVDTSTNRQRKNPVLEKNPEVALSYSAKTRGAYGFCETVPAKPSAGLGSLGLTDAIQKRIRRSAA